MRIVFMGTPDFAVETLKRCLEKHEVLGVFTQPDRPSGRGKKLTPPPVKVLAESQGINVYQPEKIKKENWVEIIKSLEPDALVVVAYGQILSKEILETPKYGSINVHASLLPKYRGAAPINWAIINGESKSGVTTMLMDVGLDTGDMLLKCDVDITNQMTAGELHDILAHKGADLLIETLKGIETGKITPEKQDHSLSNYAPMIQKEMANISWSDDAISIQRRIRGFNPWPVCYTHYEGNRIKLYTSEVISEETEGNDGEITEVLNDSFIVKCGKGSLKVTELQYGNGKRMPVKAFLLGNTIEKGKILKEA